MAHAGVRAAVHEGAAHRARELVFLALPSPERRHLIRWVTPWVSTLMAHRPPPECSPPRSPHVSDGTAVWVACAAAMAVARLPVRAGQEGPRGERGRRGAERSRVRGREGRPEATHDRSGAPPQISSRTRSPS
ncbi:hypothetical protein [Nonomuraea rubra]|uniref:hypothetical protein n=1 Tax=Nonomuraea rubra TaxID=46180 RepID=UPI0031F0D702